MENYENIFNSICRLCLGYTDRKKMVPLIDENSPDGLTAYAKAVSTFARINFTIRDCFPSYMCSKCLYLLKQAIHFKLVTESSEKCLKNLKASVGSDSETFKEKIVEITMLKFYFPTEFSKTTREFVHNEENSLQHIEMYKNMENDKNQSSSKNSINDQMKDQMIKIPTPESAAQQGNIQLPPCKDKGWDKIEDFFGTYIQKKKEKEEKIIHTKLAKKIKPKPKTDFQCKICNKVLSNNYTYKCHMQSHNGYRYICEHCGRGYATNHQLQIHKITKHDIGPYLQCSQCSFKAYNTNYLSKHVRIVHAGERPYKCEKCGKAFLRLHTYKSHLLRHSEKKIQCPKCPMKFFIRSNLFEHMNSKHDRVYIYACSECNITYRKGDDVRKHKIKIHGIPRKMQGKLTRIKINDGATHKEQ